MRARQDGDPFTLSGFIGREEAVWTDTILRECCFLWELGYRMTRAFFHLRGSSIDFVGPRGSVEFSAGDDFESIHARIALATFSGSIDDMPGARVGEIMVMRGGASLPGPYIERRLQEWAGTLRANIDLLRERP
ncbi:MAG: hypothetical protein LH650_14870 [Chloroflexi bacterium]|nr:hypothetical protein [Chloroflexota bacterium]